MPKNRFQKFYLIEIAVNSSDSVKIIWVVHFVIFAVGTGFNGRANIDVLDP